jgi:dihydroorotate dehydrogenase electron transfer subunit
MHFHESLRKYTAANIDNLPVVPACLRMPQYLRISEVVVETSDVKTFIFHSRDISRIAEPGQFVMVYVFEHVDVPEEVPMSLSYIDPEKDIIGITVAKIPGGTTQAMHNHRVGEVFGIRGPYGNGFDLVGSSAAIIGGGIGLAPLPPLVELLKKKSSDVHVFIGAQSKDKLIFVDRLMGMDVKLFIATEDGTAGEKCNVVELFAKYGREKKYDSIATSGPELMIKDLLNVADELKTPLQASLERFIKCGRGLCGQCAIDGLLVCKDGPVFWSDTLKHLYDFGKSAMDVCGRIRPINEIFNKRNIK